MRSWRKTTWVIALWTALIGAWIVSGISAAAPGAAQSQAYAAGATIGVTLIFMLWLLVLLPLALVWFATKPKQNVTVYGPAGQQVLVSETEARKRVTQPGWGYQPGGGSARPLAEGDFDWASAAAEKKAASDRPTGDGWR